MTFPMNQIISLSQVTSNKECKLKTKVTHGVPFAQKFGFGSSWQKRNIADIAGGGSYAL